MVRGNRDLASLGKRHTRFMELHLVSGRSPSPPGEEGTGQVQEFERERADRRREVDAIAARLPPDLLDGMSATEYLAGIAEREAERRRRARRRAGQ